MSCTPKPGVSTTLHIHKEINKAACQDVHASAADITERVLAERVTNQPTMSLPAPVQLAQNANHRHEHLWPQDPQDLSLYSS